MVKGKYGRKKILASILILVLILAAVFGSLALLGHKEGGETTEVTEPTPVPTSSERVFIGIYPWLGHAPYVVAEEKGLFEDEGLNVKVVVFAKRYEMHYSLGMGKIHFCDADIGDLGVYAASGYPITLIIENIWDLHTDSIIIKNKFKDLSQLRGKRIAGEKNAYADYFFMVKGLEKYGLTTNDVEIIDMADEEALVAFIKGKVDAIFAVYPSLAVSEGEGKVAVVRDEIDNDPIGLVVQNEILEDNPDVVVKVLRCYFKGLKWGEEHPDEYYEIANRRLFHSDLTKETFIDLESKFKRLEPREIKEEMRDRGPLYQYCEEILDFYFDQGVIDSKPDPASFINNELYLKALEDYEEDYE
jgi:NitT/TauT family transport system substrate-binding protein